MDKYNQIVHGDSLSVLKQWPDDFVHCVITSPPYYGLRSYLPNEHNDKQKELGLEKSPEEYVAKMVEIFREVKRVLHPSGSLWLNLGDSYWGGKGKSGYELPHEAEDRKNRGETIQTAHNIPGYMEMRPTDGKHDVIKPKDFLMMPSRLAMELQKDGWYLRSMIPWVKRNSMPESASDRPTTAVEYLFLLTKSPRYFYDAEAVRVKQSIKTGFGVRKQSPKQSQYNRKTQLASYVTPERFLPNGRSRRNSDWFWESWQGLYEEDGEPLALVVNPQGFKEAHFATFPEKLVEPCIKAGTSERGVCPECGEQWGRILEQSNPNANTSGRTNLQKDQQTNEGRLSLQRPSAMTQTGIWKTLGWKPQCDCGKEPVPAVVLDPFMGAGTVAVVAKRLGRNYIGTELNPDYISMSNRRIDKVIVAEQKELI